jgi:hypothetical protein
MVMDALVYDRLNYKPTYLLMIFQTTMIKTRKVWTAVRKVWTNEQCVKQKTIWHSYGPAGVKYFLATAEAVSFTPDTVLFYGRQLCCHLCRLLQLREIG